MATKIWTGLLKINGQRLTYEATTHGGMTPQRGDDPFVITRCLVDGQDYTGSEHYETLVLEDIYAWYYAGEDRV